MELHVTFLEGSIHSLSEGFAIWSKLQSSTPEKRNAHQIAELVDKTCLGVSRFLKYSISKSDSYLLVEKLSPQLIRTLHSAMLAKKSTSIFTTGVQFNTFTTAELLKVFKEIVHPDLDSADYEIFSQAVSDL